MKRFYKTCVVIFATSVLAMTSVQGEPAATRPANLAGQSFQIENLDQPLLLRPQDASSKNGTPLVLYPHESWKCMTWKLEASGSGYRLMNYFTHKTLQPDAEHKGDASTPVVQQPVAKVQSTEQQWNVTPLGNGEYKIENAKTGEALGAADGAVRTSKWTGSPSQKWKLLPKPAKFTG